MHSNNFLNFTGAVRLCANTTGLMQYTQTIRGGPNPEEKANWLSKLTLWYINPILRTGIRWVLLLAHGLGDHFGPSLLFAILMMSKESSFLSSGLVLLISNIFEFVPPYALNQLVDYMELSEPNVWFGLLQVLILVIGFTTIYITWNRFAYMSTRSGMHMRSSLAVLIYEKAMKLSSQARKVYSQGEIVNLVSVDAERFDDAPWSIHYLWSAPIVLLANLVVLWMLLGPSILAGFGVLAVLVPLTIVIGRKSDTMQEAMMETKDKRLKHLNELFQNIRIVKFFVWERKYLAQVTEVRSEEVAKLRWLRYLWAVSDLVYHAAPLISTAVTFVVYAATGHELSPKLMFTALALFANVKFPLLQIPDSISDVVQMKVSFGRIFEFLMAEELDKYKTNDFKPQLRPTMEQPKEDRIPPKKTAPKVEKPEASVGLLVDLGSASAAVSAGGVELSQVPDSLIHEFKAGGRKSLVSDEVAVKITDGSFRWDNMDQTDTLQELNLTVKKGQFVVIVGAVGSGKSSVLGALLGEMETTNGSVECTGSIAYAAQLPWVLQDTVRQNILLGYDMEEERYNRVIDCCALGRDLELLPGGDLCEVGEKGVSLSGGQRHRVSLARAVYRNSDVYLLEDIFSAVDAHVGKHIFEKTLLGELEGKTRILVTHHTFTLPSADWIVYMKDGRIERQGTYEELVDSGLPLISIVQEQEKHEQLRMSMEEIKPEAEAPGEDDDDEEENKQAGAFAAEERAIGVIKWDIIKYYIAILGIASTLIIIVGSFSGDILSIIKDYYLANWSDDEEGHPVATALMVYSVLAVVSTLVVFVEELLLAAGVLRAARTLHDTLLTSIIRAPMVFFDTTPLGRILNRFSKDTDAVDVHMGPAIQDFVSCLSIVTTTVCLICFSSPLFIIVLIPLGGLYWYIQQYFRSSSRELKRLEAVASSPVFGHVSQTLNGTSSIRAFKLEGFFLSLMQTRLDVSNTAYLVLWSANRWLAIRLAFVGLLVTSFFALLGVISKTLGFGNATSFGLALTYAISLTDYLNWMLRMLAEIETRFNSVERMQQYIQLQQEPPAQTDVDPLQPWPENGVLEFDNVVMRYRPELEPALRGVSFKSKPREKIGICGRTGAGKSSILLALFRFVEVESGGIFIDGVDVSRIGLDALRKTITIIPQDASIVSGTVRTNLDPFNEKSDEDLFEVLKMVGLYDKVNEFPEGLEYQVTEHGGNFSVGECQLLALARSLCRDSKVLVLDEASAQLDNKTDQLIQQMIKQTFTDKTVLTIAHRLHSIMDYDRIIVMDAGKVAEFDTPQNLKANPNSIFASMLRDAHM